MNNDPIEMDCYYNHTLLNSSLPKLEKLNGWKLLVETEKPKNNNKFLLKFI